MNRKFASCLEFGGVPSGFGFVWGGCSFVCVFLVAVWVFFCTIVNAFKVLFGISF